MVAPRSIPDDFRAGIALMIAGMTAGAAAYSALEGAFAAFEKRGLRGALLNICHNAGAARLRPSLAALLLVVPFASARAADTHDWALSAPYAAKLASPLLLAPLAARDPRVALLSGAVLAVGLSLPSAMVLKGVHGGEKETREWRRAAYACDMALGLGLAGWGLWSIREAKSRGHGKDGDDKAAEEDALEAAWLVAGALPFLAAAQLDLIPFHAEGPPRLSLTLLPVGTGGGPGLAARLAAAL